MWGRRLPAIGAPLALVAFAAGCSAVLGIEQFSGMGASDGGASGSSSSGGKPEEDGGTLGDGAATSEGGLASSIIAQNQESPVAITVNANNVYWIDGAGGTIFYCPKTGCSGAPTPITTFVGDGSTNPYRYGIAVDSLNVYWFASTSEQSEFTLMQCAIAGCNDTPTLLFTAQLMADISVGPTSVFTAAYNVAVEDGGGTFGAAGVMECTIGGCDGAPTMFATEPTIQAVAVSDGNVYWTAADPQVQQDLKVCPLSGCVGTPTLLLSGPFPLKGGLLVTGSTVLVAYQAYPTPTPGVLSCPTSGCGSSPTTLVSNLQGIPSPVVQADATNVYFLQTASEASEIMACGLAGCSNQARLVVAAPVDDFVVDDTSIYWIDAVGGKVLAARK